MTVSGGTLKVGDGGSTGYLPGYDPIAYAGLPPTVPTISLASGATLEFNHAAGGPTQNTAHAVVITGAGNVLVSGAKEEVFVANNNYSGTTTINNGSKLRIGWGGASNVGGLGATAVANSGLLTFSNDHNATFPGSVSGSGALLKEFSGTLTLTGAATHTGGTTINGGTLQVGNGGTTGALSGNIANSATLAFNRSDSSTFGGAISGAGAVVKTGLGTLSLTTANTYTGGTTVSNGTLLVNNTTGSGTGTGTVSVQSGAVLGGTGAISGVVTISSGGHVAPGASIESLDAGFLTLSAGSILDFELDTVAGVDKSDLVNVTATNGLTINGGMLNLTNAGAMTTGTYTLIDYAGSLNGSLGNMTLGSTPSDFSFQLVNNTGNKSIDLVVTPGGDFDHNGAVNAADYVTWRKGVGTTYTGGDYNSWREHFGETNASAGASLAAVPEPAAWLLLLFGISAVLAKRQRFALVR
jgi:autotransporter-associated beta strand protein